MNTLNNFKKCTEKEYNLANTISNEHTAYLRIGTKRMYFVKRNIPQMKIITKEIILKGQDIDIKRAIDKIKKDCHRVEIN